MADYLQSTCNQVFSTWIARGCLLFKAATVMRVAMITPLIKDFKEQHKGAYFPVYETRHCLMAFSSNNACLHKEMIPGVSILSLNEILVKGNIMTRPTLKTLTTAAWP